MNAMEAKETVEQILGFEVNADYTESATGKPGVRFWVESISGKEHAAEVYYENQSTASLPDKHVEEVAKRLKERMKRIGVYENFV